MQRGSILPHTMPIRINSLDTHLHVHWEGELTTQDLGTLFGELPSIAARSDAGRRILHTIDPTAELRLGPLEAFNYSRRLIGTQIPVHTKAAFVAHTPAGVAIARNFANFNRNPGLSLRSFVTEKDALEWLAAPDN